MTMLWKKHRLSQWQAAEFSITETLDEKGAFRLEAVGVPPEFFDSLEKAKTYAGTLNALALTRQENESLRAELARLRNPTTVLVEATRLPAIAIAPAAGPKSWADDGDGPWPDGDLADQDWPDDRADTGRSVPKPVDSPEVTAIAGRLAALLERNGRAGGGNVLTALPTVEPR